MSEKIILEENIDRIAMPENLDIGLMVARQHEKCASVGCDFDYYGFAFGQSPFHIPPPVARALEEAAVESGYAEAEGIEELRSAAAAFNARHFDLAPDPERIIVGPGTKGLFFLLFSILSGEIIIPVPSWIGYAPQAAFLDKKYHSLKTDYQNGYKLIAEDLELFLKKQPVDKQFLLVLNNPHNPTGGVYSKEELASIANTCRKHGIIVLADEIYALTTFDFSSFTSMGTIYPEKTFVLSGLSKDRSAGGYRLGICHLPDADCRKIRSSFQKLAATVYTNITTPVQKAAVTAYSENGEIEKYFSFTREINRIMGSVIHNEFAKIDGIYPTKPAGGFYFYADFNEIKDELKKAGIENSNQLGRALISHPHHIATVTGDSLLLSPDDYGARIAYVDYNGYKAYHAFQENRPSTPEEETAFVKEYASLMLEGAKAVADFVAAVQAGKL